MSVKDTMCCFSLYDKLWQCSWRGRGAQAQTRWDPVLQFIPVCSYINSLTVGHAHHGCQKHCPVTLQFEQVEGVITEKTKYQPNEKNTT